MCLIWVIVLDRFWEEIEAYLRTDMVDDVLHFSEWQQSFHERDLEAGIRMD